MMPRADVVIPHWNRRELLESLLVRLREQSVAPERILVVDDGSTDGSPEAAARLGACVLSTGRRAGFAAAVNLGLRRSRAPWVALLNNDVEPAPDWLERLLAAAESQQVWFAVGKLLQQSDPSRMDGAFDALCRGGCSWRIGHGRPDGPLWSRPRAVRMAGFAAVLVRRELFEKVGYLDERFQFALEDVEFGLRCALAGCGGWYVPEAVAYHAGSATLGRWSAAAVRWIARNQLFLVARHYPPDWRKRYGRAVLVAQGLWALVAARHGRLAAYLLGKREGWRLFEPVRSASPPRADPERLDEVLCRSEAEIRLWQSRTGWDRYWKLYFRLAGGGRAQPLGDDS